MTVTKLTKIQAALTLVIVLLLVMILYPAWTVAAARFALKTEFESGATLAERYLILGDWPSGNDNNQLRHFDEYPIKTQSPVEHSQLGSEVLKIAATTEAKK